MIESTINSRKFDWSVHRTWRCQLLEETAEHWLFFGTFENEIRHRELGIIRPGTTSYEYYWKTKWYNVFRFHEPDGRFRLFYCNINLPPTYTDGTLDYIDLDLDVIVGPDFSPVILDEDEYRENARRFAYPAGIMRSAEESLAQLLSLIQGRRFPFDCRS